MKTRDELILDFMLALASGLYAAQDYAPADSEDIYNDALGLANEYLKHL